MELYTYWRSSAAYRARIALNLKGLSYQAHYVDLLRDGGEQWSADYRAVNPQSRVPTLIHDGRKITQSLAIIEYLDEAFPNTYLLPRDPVGRARVRALSLIIAADVQPLQNTSTTRYLREVLKLDDAAVNAWLREWIGRGLDAFATLIERDPVPGAYCHGDAPTMADCVLVPQMFAAARFGADLSRYGGLQRIVDACNELPAFRKAAPSEQPDAR